MLTSLTNTRWIMSELTDSGHGRCGIFESVDTLGEPSVKGATT